jgi:hypothetical protein
MDMKQRAERTALPTDDRPDVHRPPVPPISLEQDKDIRDGNLPADRFDDDRMRELPHESGTGAVEAEPLKTKRP